MAETPPPWFSQLCIVLRGEAQLHPSLLNGKFDAKDITPEQRMQLKILSFDHFDRRFDVQAQRLLWVVRELTHDAALACPSALVSQALQKIYERSQMLGFLGLPRCPDDNQRRLDWVHCSDLFEDVLTNLTDPMTADDRNIARSLWFYVAGGRPANRFVLAAAAGFSDLAKTAKQDLLDAAGPIGKRELNVLFTLPDRSLIPYLDFTPTATRDALLTVPGYLKFAKNALQEVSDHLRAMQAGEAAYKPDKGVNYDDCRIIEHVIFAGLQLQLDWVQDVLPQLWRDASQAPDAKAKTMPSQRLTMGIGKLMIDCATAPNMQLFGDIRTGVRHAGVRKKLDKYHKQAMAKLAKRPDLIQQLPAGEPIPKNLVTAVKKSYESLLWQAAGFTYDDWHSRFVAAEQIAPMTQKLIWEVTGTNNVTVTVLWDKTGHWRGVDDAQYEAMAGQHIRLWHPVDSTAQARSLWRDRLLQGKITQPFAQAFREHYRPHEVELKTCETAMFEGYGVLTDPIGATGLGLGWEIDYDQYVVTREACRFALPFHDHIYPGSGSYGTTPGLRLISGADSLGDLPPRVLSEVLRQVDLLVSVGAASLDWDSSGYDRILIPGQRTIDMRETVLQRLFAAQVADGVLKFDGRAVFQGATKVHLATGRVTRNGDPVEVTPAKRAWLPYEDKSLDKLIKTLVTLVEQRC